MWVCPCAWGHRVGVRVRVPKRAPRNPAESACMLFSGPRACAGRAARNGQEDRNTKEGRRKKDEDRALKNGKERQWESPLLYIGTALTTKFPTLLAHGSKLVRQSGLGSTWLDLAWLSHGRNTNPDLKKERNTSIYAAAMVALASEAKRTRVFCPLVSTTM